MRRLLLAAAVGSIAALALLLGRASGPAHAAVTPPPTFGQPTISGLQGNGFEQDIRLDPTNVNRIYTSAPGALSSDTSWIWHSEDAGKTFKWVSAALPLTGKPTSCGGGGDTELAVDSQGHLYFNDLTLVNFSTARSDNGGRTFTNGIGGDCNNTGVPDAVVDRQWYATDGDPTNGGTIYLVNDEIGPGAPTCGSSTGNNELVMYRSPAPLAPASTAGVTFGPPKKISDLLGCNEGIMGNDEVSPVTHHIFVVHDDATFNHIFMGRCVAVTFLVDPSGLQCVDLPVASFPGFKTGANFPTMAIDKAGNLYAVWEQAPVDANGFIVGDADLMYAYSTYPSEGNTWSTPVKISTGLHNHVFAWPAAGDDGRVDIAFYGTNAVAGPPTFDQNCNNFLGATKSGPDVTNGIWSLYMVQTLNGHAFSPTFTAPILAGEHYNHKGTINTVMGGQCGDRTLGDFLQLRIGSKGEAQISYADSNNIDEVFAPHAMYVRQTGGTGVFALTAVSGDPILLNTTTDPSGDGTYDQAGTSSANLPNLDILNSNMSRPAAADCHPAGTPCYRVKMILTDLNLNPPAVEVPGTLDTDTDIVWHTQWLVPANPSCVPGSPGCDEGGKNFFVYAESTGGQAVKCFSGENAAQALGGGVALTYPGLTQITDAAACSVVVGPNGSITIDVPISDVSINALNSTLYSVTASTMTLQGPANAVPVFAGLGGSFFNVLDVARAYDANFTSTTAVTSLSLAPKTETKVIGSQGCVTATVTTASGTPASSKLVRFSVTGANTRSGSGTTNASGEATFCYQGIAAGDDSITAYADLNNSNTQDPGEPSDTASKTWVAPSTNCEATITNGGQITTDNRDKANFGGNAKGSNGTTTGQEQYTDHGPAESVDVHSTSVVSITCSSSTQATIFGQATNGSGSVGYRIDVIDNGEPGKNDRYHIQLSNGYDSGDHTLSGGNVQIH